MQAAVVGVPGTGKTFFMVSYLKKYFTYDEFFREYTIKDDVLILTNIAGLKFYGASCWDVESPELLGNASQGIKGKITREEFFTVDYMQQLMDKTGKKNIILSLDEIQRDQYFPVGFKTPEVLFLFAYHRHIGMDIILGTQDITLISKGVLAQCEYLAHGTLRSKKLMGTMSYRFTDNKGRFLYDKGMRPNKEVFAAYQSASTEEVNKPKNAVMHWIIITSCFLVLAGGLFKGALAVVANKAKPENARKQISPSAAAMQEAAAKGASAVVISPSAPGGASGTPSASPAPPPSPVTYNSYSAAAPVVSDTSRVQVVGVIHSGNFRRYLLSDGRTVASSRVLRSGDYF